jgi:hypothetical protein
MIRKLQLRADDLSEHLAICELEMRRSRTFAQRLDAYQDVGRVIEQIDVLRRDADILHARDRDAMFDRLDRRVVRLMRSMPYRTIEWILTAKLTWLLSPASAESQAC